VGAALFLALSAGAQQKTPGPQLLAPNQARGDGYHVDVVRVVRVRVGENKLAYSIEYRYDFARRDSVYIDHLGTVPPQGSFRYLVMEPVLVFKETADGATLTKVSLTETVLVAAKPPLNRVPSESEFPPAHTAFSWRSALSLQEQANAVLSKYFHYMPCPTGNVQKVNCILTTFAPLSLPDLPEGALGQVALLISFPYDTQSDHFQVYVQTLVREGRSHSDDFRPTSNAVLMKGADGFVAKVLTELQGGGRP
jgi:hypothetical protein